VLVLVPQLFSYGRSIRMNPGFGMMTHAKIDWGLIISILSLILIIAIGACLGNVISPGGNTHSHCPQRFVQIAPNQSLQIGIPVPTAVSQSSIKS
jgi:hypothetical protein